MSVNAISRRCSLWQGLHVARQPACAAAERKFYLWYRSLSAAAAPDNPPMQVFRGFHHPGIAPACALTIGNFDGVHRGHQAMLALLRSEARHRGLPTSVLTFEPHPRDHFAALAGKPELAPARIATLRDKLGELERCGIDQAIVMRFDARFASQSPQAFIGICSPR